MSNSKIFISTSNNILGDVFPRIDMHTNLVYNIDGDTDTFDDQYIIYGAPFAVGVPGTVLLYSLSAPVQDSLYKVDDNEHFWFRELDTKQKSAVEIVQ